MSDLLSKYIQEPLTNTMCQIAIPKMKGYWHDLIHDAMTLVDAKEDDCYLWGYRETGTNLMPLGSITEIRDAISMINSSTNPANQYYLIHVVRKRHGKYADGYMKHLQGTTAEETVRSLRRCIEERITQA